MVLAAQWKSSTYLLVPMLQEIQSRNSEKQARGRLLGFRLWYLVMCAFTIFNLLDQMTNALFAAKIFATKQCHGYNKIQGFWEITIQKMFPEFLRNSIFFFLDDLDFADITVGLYVIQLLSQPIYALIFTFPYCPNFSKINFGVLVDPTDKIQTFKTISDDSNEETDKTDFKTAVMVLAEVNRMEGLVSFDLDYREAMIERLMREADRCDTTNEKENLVEEALEVALAVLARSAARFALKGLVQNCLQVSLQVSMQAISKGAMPDYDFFNGVNLGVTMLAVLLDIPDMISIWAFISWVKCEIMVHVSENVAGFPRVHSRMDTVWYRFLRIKIYFVLYVLIAGRALVMLYMVLVVCKDGEWNLTDINNGNYGCVAFDLPPDKTARWNCTTSEYQCHYNS